MTDPRSRRRTIGRTPAAAAAAAGRRTSGPKIHDKCRWCHASILWLEHTGTHKLAPIDVDPVPGGNVLVLRTAAGALDGHYTVVAKDEQALFDATVQVSLDATPTMHLNHWATCTSITAKRLARERSAREAAGRKLERDHLAAPADVVASRATCTRSGCGLPLDPKLAEREPEFTTHPSCDTPTDPKD